MTKRQARLKNVYVVADVVPQQAKFYEDVLGLSLKYRDNDKWLQYDSGTTGFAVSNEEEAYPAISGNVLVFEVDSFDGVDEDVNNAGGLILGIRDMGTHGTVMSIRDPEGNVVQLFIPAKK